MAASGHKARYWVGIGYTENMQDDWREEIGDILQLPFAYTVHDKDVDEKGDPRKTHVHVLIAFPNTTTHKHVKEVLNRLAMDDVEAFPTVEPCVSVRHSYDYLIHDTENSRKKHKHPYDPSERVCGNSFDIGSYEQMGLAEKKDRRSEMMDFVVEHRIPNLNICYRVIRDNFDEESFNIFVDNLSMFDRLCRGNFLQVEAERTVKKKALESD